MEIPGTLAGSIEDARRRVQRHRQWRVWLVYCLPVSAGCLSFAVVSRFVYLPHFAAILAGAAAAGLAGAGLLARRLRVGAFAAAAQLDLAEGLKERLSTVVEVSQKGGSGEVVNALVADAQVAAREVSPEVSLAFHAPHTLPLTLGFAIVTAALALAPGGFGTAESALPRILQIALKEAVRVNTTADLLEESGAPGNLVRQFRKAGEDLGKGKTESTARALQAVRASLADARQRDAAMEAFAGSDVLKKLAEMVSSGASAQAVAKEAAVVAENHPQEAAALLKDIADRLQKDSRLRESIEDAIKALNERDRKAFARAVEELMREVEKLPDTGQLEMAHRTLQKTADKVGASKSGTPTGTHREGAPGMPPGPGNGSRVAVGEGTALEEAMKREKVPERFRGIVRAYFARSNQNMKQ